MLESGDKRFRVFESQSRVDTSRKTEGSIYILSMPINFFTNKKTTDSTKETQYCTDFVITINSAYGLESVRKKHEMEVYAKVSLGAEPATEKRTPANKHGGRNPTWNCQMKYTIGKSAVDRHGLVLWIKLYCRRGVLRKDKYIGEVSVQIKNLYDPNFLSGVMTEPVRKGSKVSEGSLTFSFSFGDMYPMKKPSFLKKAFIVVKAVGQVVHVVEFFTVFL